MRIAVVTDIHANLTALEAVVADIEQTGADVIVQGGDLVGGCARPSEVIDRIRELGWPGVYGNTDEMLWRPARVAETLQAPRLHRIRDLLVGHTIPATLDAIGNERVEWLKRLGLRWTDGHVTVVHAAPDDAWQAVTETASDEELDRVYGALRSTHVVYGHIHTPFVRRLSTFTLINAGAVGLPLDGDTRAAYALITDDGVEIRRVEYDVEKEIRLLQPDQDPFAASTAATLRTGRYAAPSQ